MKVTKPNVSVEPTGFSFGDSEKPDFAKRETSKKRVYVSGGSKVCSGCGGAKRLENQRYCLLCHAAYMREWRKTHPMNREQKQKDNARSYANVYQRRGKLLKQPCEVCGNLKSEKHHDDYSKPLEVRWLCRKHHLEHHKRLRTPTGKQLQNVQMEQRKRRSAPAQTSGRG